MEKNTFIIKSKDEVSHALKSILNTGTRAFISPYYYAPKEYRVVFLDGKAEVVITKILNKETGKYNISLGATAYIETDIELIKILEDISIKVSNIFGIPNLKRFSGISEEYNDVSKKIFQKAFLFKFNSVYYN